MAEADFAVVVKNICGILSNRTVDLMKLDAAKMHLNKFANYFTLLWQLKTFLCMNSRK